MTTLFHGPHPAQAFPISGISQPQRDSDRRWRPEGPRWRGYFRRHHQYRDHDRGVWRYHHRRHRHSDAAAVIGGLAAGAIIGGALTQSQQPRNDEPHSYAVGSGHVSWCYRRYRSYRAYDNTFQPFDGPRRQAELQADIHRFVQRPWRG
ncbi:BA14K family protein [Rhizobium laguerreae]|uniref:BA14K family protein n=1 Tax=Rhizobium laguerreae TaxID=1076926 RepID=UPI001C90E9D7|nr:BA14K family protein [Rhizobium laguerreae]MBY3075521.1 BA14K family protein [Rhizobium laguerreae]